MLIATFSLLPYPLSLPPSPSHPAPINSTFFAYLPGNPHQQQLHDETDILPLPWPALGETVQTQKGEENPWRFLQERPRAQSLLRRHLSWDIPPWTRKEMPTIEAGEEAEGEAEEREEQDLGTIEQRLITRSTVTFVRDFSTYSLDKFRTKQNALAVIYVRPVHLRSEPSTRYSDPHCP